MLRSWATINGERRLYQEGNVAAMRTPDDLIARYMEGKDVLEPGTVMFGGTLPTIGGISPAPRFEFELQDPVLNLSLIHI